MFFIIEGLHWFFQGKYYQYDSTWVDDTGTLVQLAHGGRGGSSFLHYVFNGQDYEIYSHYNLSIWHNVLGEKYVIKVNPQDPEKYVPLSWLPVFSAEEEKGVTIGTIDEIKENRPLYRHRSEKILLSDHSVFFTYIIHGTEFDTGYKREQDLPPDYTSMFPMLKVGQTFEVHYWKEKPGRAIIFLDRPRAEDVN